MYDDGIIIDLTPYLDEFTPPVQGGFRTQQLGYAQTHDNGMVLGFYKITYADKTPYIFFDTNLAWLEEYGKSESKIIAEHEAYFDWILENKPGVVPVWFDFTAPMQMDLTMGDGFLLGSDHYYTLNQTWKQNNPTPQYGIHVYYSMEMMRLMGMPPSVLEMPAGTPADTPPILPEDLLACYQTNLAMGMKGCNYYVYTGGPNFPGTGNTCEIYDYNAHVHADGTLNPAYESLKTFGKFAESHAWMQRGGRRGSAVIGFEWKSTRSADVEYAGQQFSRTDCWEFTRLGVIYTMMCSEMAPELVNLDGALDLSRPLIVPCASVMSAQAQQALIDFAEQGGQLLLLGTLPEMDEELRPCTLLRKYLGNPVLKKPFRTGATVNCASYGDVYNMTPLHVIETRPEGAETLLTAPRSGQILGFRKGNVRYMAIKWLMNTFDQPAMLEQILREMGAVPCVKSSNRNIFTALWEDDGNNRLTMVMNLYSSPQSTEITVYGKDSEVLNTAELHLGAMEVRILE